MTRFRLTHLTFLGKDVADASVEFAPDATVIHGPSNTGKSFIGDAINYMLGGRSLRKIPQMSGYSTALLGVQLPSEERITLARGLQGGSFQLLAGSVLSTPLPAPVTTLHYEHAAAEEGNVSGYLLAALDLLHVRLRTNQQNQTRSLSFRDVAHLVLIDETRIQSTQPPGLTGQRMQKTAELSALKFFLQGQDDSGLVEVQKPGERRSASQAKVQVVDQLIATLEQRLTGIAEPAQVADRRRRLDTTIAGYSVRLAALDADRRAALDDLRQLDSDQREVLDRVTEVTTLQARFGLLEQKYTSDLDRLELVAETGTLLGMFHPGTCVFCGAEPMDQHPAGHEAHDSTQLSMAVRREQEETIGLREGLRATIADLAGERETLVVQQQQLSQGLIDQQQRVDELERGLEPQQTELGELLDQRSIVQRHLDDYEQLQTLTVLRSTFVAEGKTAAKPEPASELTLKTADDFSRAIVQRLAAWGYPDSERVRYDRKEQDVIAGDQARSAQGKGVRAVLHAGFTLGLAQFCLDNDLPHPGFVVLDSPLVTYRPPKPEDTAQDRNVLPTSLMEDFYQDLAERFAGQVVVLENVSPTQPLPAGSTSVEFTKSSQGRTGFFPVS